MHAINFLMIASLVIGGVVVMWSIYDLYIKLHMYSTLIRSLADDPEFVQGTSHIWETEWENQCADEEFNRLRAIIRKHIEKLGFRRPQVLIEPLTQAHLINRLRYIQGLACDVEKHVQLISARPYF